MNDYAYEDQSYLPNQELARQTAALLPGDWATEKANAAATRELLDAFRTASVEESCQTAAGELRRRGSFSNVMATRGK